MALLGDAARFENGGSWYTQYRRYPFFVERAAWVNTMQPTGKLLVAGCGWGYLVDELVQLGRDAWGCDASSYCVGKTVAGNRVLLGSVLVRADLDAVKAAAGVAPAGKFAVCVTEDLLPCLALAELPAARTELLRAASTLLHIATMAAPGPDRLAELLWQPVAKWKGQIPDTIYDAERGVVV